MTYTWQITKQPGNRGFLDDRDLNETKQDEEDHWIPSTDPNQKISTNVKRMII